MVERFVVIGLATVLAVFVLVLTLFSEPSTPRVARRTIDDPVELSQMPKFDPNRSTSRIDPRGQAKKYRISSTNSRGQLVELYGDSLTPLPEGVSRVDSPGARIHFEPNRVLQIRAQEGTVLAPDNQVRSGHFDDQVVLTLFHSQPNQPLDLSDQSHDAKLNLYLDQARFDLELGRIESDKNVHLIGQNIDFSGVGLDLIYNNLRHRIDRLEIMQGKELRFTPAPQATSVNADPTLTSSTDPNNHEPERDTSHSVSPPLTDAPQPRDHLQAPAQIAPASDRVVQYYRARFEDGVRVRSRTATIDADRLDIVFSLDAESDQGLNLLGRRWSGQPSHVATHHPDPAATPSVANLPLSALALYRPSTNGSIQSMLTQLVTLVLTQSNHVASSETTATSPPQGDEVVITWTGRLLIEPEESPPIDMAGPDDLLLVLMGRPVRITTVRREVITAASVDYLASDGRVRMFSTEPHPLEIKTPNMGVLRGQRLVIHQNQGIGQIIGAGSLTTGKPVSARKADQSVSSLATIATQPNRRDPLQVTWNDRVDLSFFNSDSTGSPSGPQSMFSRIAGLKDAIFRGDVRMKHSQFALATDMLIASFNAPASDNQQTLDAIQAVGNALVDVHATGDAESAQIQSDRLEVDLTHDDASIRPTSLTAMGHVVARQAQRSIHAGQLELAIDAQPKIVPSFDTAQTHLTDDAPALAPLSLALAQPTLKAIGVLDPVPALSKTLDTPNEDNASPPSQLDALSPWVNDADAWSGFDVLGTADRTAWLPESAAQVTPSLSEDQPNGDNNAERSDRFVVSRMTARSDVRISLGDLGVHAKADRLEGDARGDQIEFFGHGDQPARIERFDGALTGNHIVMNQAGQTVHVNGPGTITFINTPPNTALLLPKDTPQADTDPLLATPQTARADRSADDVAGSTTPPPAATARSDDQGMRVAVTWADAMHFDNRFGLAQFLGGVVSEAQTDRETTHLYAQDLRLEFTELPESLSATPITDDPLADSSLDRFTGTGRSVRLVTAQQDVVFQATKWSDEPGGPFDTRVRLNGPLVNFDNVAEQVQVIGPGAMLVEDYRVRSKQRKHDQRATSLFGTERTGQAKFTGRGATLLKWRSQLSFDAYHNDMRADTGVQMIHRSLDSQLTVQVDCQRLLGDLEATGGLGVWVAGHAPQPRLKAVYADDNVRVISDDRTIRTDHLEYTGFDETILLRADPGRLTQIHEHSQPTALTAERFRWYLQENRLEILKLGPARMSLTPTE